MTKRIFLAGASGAIGRRLAPLLLQDGWQVVGSTRSHEKAAELRALGVEPAVVDVYDAEALRNVVAAAKPDVVIHQLTDLPYALEAAQMAEGLKRNARLRDEGTRNLVAAAVFAGARRLIAQSISFIYAEGTTPRRESDPLLPLTHPAYGETVAAVLSLEHQVLVAPLEGLVLRYGLIYGPGTGFDSPIAPGSLHVDAAAQAARQAATTGAPGIYNAAENEGGVDSSKAIAAFSFDPSWRP